MPESSEKENYQKLLLDLIGESDDDQFLEFMYRFTKRAKENWGC